MPKCQPRTSMLSEKIKELVCWRTELELVVERNMPGRKSNHQTGLLNIKEEFLQWLRNVGILKCLIVFSKHDRLNKMLVQLKKTFLFT